jgi:hypothetical protein
MGPAAIRGAVPLGAKHTIIVDHGIEDGSQHSSVGSPVSAQAVEHELGNRCVPHQVGPTENLQMPGDRRLGQVEHRL